MNADQIKKLERLKSKCSKCGGVGYLPNKTAYGFYLEDCTCVKTIENRIGLVEANIPEEYWDWDFRRLTNDFKEKNSGLYKCLKAYLENISKNIESGKGFWLASPPGHAKSSIITYFLREGMKQGYSVYYSKASHLMSKKFEALKDSEAKRFIEFIVNKVDLLAIEEIEKVYLIDDLAMPNVLFYELLSDLYDSKKSLLISSNEKRQETYKRFPNFIKDRLNTMEYFPIVGGVSGRKKG